jgi:hypothetical protein
MNLPPPLWHPSAYEAMLADLVKQHEVPADAPPSRSHNRSM